LGLLSVLGQDTTTNTTTNSTGFIKATSETAIEEAEDIACNIYADYYFYDTSSLRNETADYVSGTSRNFRSYVFNFC